MRRREPTPEQVDRPKPPRWISSSMDGIKHFAGVDAEGHIVLGTPARQLLNKARDEWCRDKGCWRPGTKTCEQATGRPCTAREARP